MTSIDEMLEPCPFCGSPAALQEGENREDHHGRWFNLGCSNSFLSVGAERVCIGGMLFFTEAEKSVSQAVAEWNRRSPDAAAHVLRQSGWTVGEPGRPPTPGQWALIVLCPKCGNKRCPKAENPAFRCSGSNEPGQIGEPEARPVEAAP